MFRLPVMSAMRMPVLAGIMVLAGCASWKHGESLPPDVGIRIVDADPTTLGGTVVVTNHSRKRILILTNQLVLSPEPGITRGPRPYYDPGEGRMAWSHDRRVAPGESVEYMKVREIDTSRHDFPAIHACWDNRHWNCDQYWLVPADQSWEDLIGGRCPWRTDFVAPSATAKPASAFRGVSASRRLPAIIAMLGPAAREVGSGLHVLEWDVTDGRVFSVSAADACSEPMSAGFRAR